MAHHLQTKKVYSPTTHKNPSPNTMLTKLQKCINTKKLQKHIKNKVLEFQIAKSNL